MRRLAAILGVLGAALGSVFLTGAGESGDRYLVRAIFDNASFLVPGEEVRVAGVKVGSIDAVEVTSDNKAAVVLDITDEGYKDFRSDAECTIRPQSLIGEKFVECSPTEPRPDSAEAPPALRKIEGDGEGSGQYLLPVENTVRNVDLDLIGNMSRQPYAQRLSVIVSELGLALAGRGEDLNEVVRRANPALKELGAVLRLIGSQNDRLEQLAVDSDAVIAPLARDRRRVTSFIENASDVAEATAERRDDLEANFERLPEFLAELRPTMVRLGALADEMSPVVSDLGDVAPDINRLLLELGPFSRAATPAIESLGDLAEPGIPAVTESRPIVRDLRTLARNLRPVGDDLEAILTSFRKNDGLERVLDYIFYQVAAINGYDSFGHYLRAALLVNSCSTYAVTPVEGCSANFNQAGSTASASASGAPRDPVLERTRRILAGEDPEDVLGDADQRKARAKADRDVVNGTGDAAPAATPPPIQADEGAQPTVPPPTTAPSTKPQTEALLDFLFGGGSG